MTLRATPPFRADHVGSLLRPAELLAARDDFAAGKIDAAALTAVEDAAIRDAVKLQEDAGLRLATDGEFRREQWHADFLYAIGGIDRGALGTPVPVYTRDGQITWTPNVTEVTGPVRLEETIFGDHFTFLKETVTTAWPKITVPSPSHGALPRRPVQVALHRPRGVPRGRRRRLRGRGRRAVRARLPVPAVRRHDLRVPERPPVAGQRQGHRARPGPPARDQRQRDQRGATRQAGRHGGHPAHVPRQLPLGVVLLRRLRLRGRGRLRRAQGRRAVPRVRRRAVGHVRAAPLRAGRPGRGARA